MLRQGKAWEKLNPQQNSRLVLTGVWGASPASGCGVKKFHEFFPTSAFWDFHSGSRSGFLPPPGTHPPTMQPAQVCIAEASAAEPGEVQSEPIFCDKAYSGFKDSIWFDGTLEPLWIGFLTISCSSTGDLSVTSVCTHWKGSPMKELCSYVCLPNR